MPQLWAGIDAGKSNHHCVVIDETGTRLLSRKVANEEDDVLALLADVTELADSAPISWATDSNQGGAALLIAVLAAHGQEMLYVPGRTVHHAARTYRGDSKTDAKDAAIIADQTRMRRDIFPIRDGDEIAAELRMLAAHRTDLVADKTRAINRLRATLLGYFPGLEAAFDYATRKAALVLLTKYQTPAQLRRSGVTRVTAWLRNAGCHNPAAVAEAAVDAANRQHSVVPGQDAAALIVARLAREVLRLKEEVEEVESQLETRFRRHEWADTLLSIPGFGPLLAAEFIGATGGTMRHFANADRLAGTAGAAPVPCDSGRISGNLHRPKRYDRRLLRACYMSAEVATRHHPESRTYYDRKRAEGKRHKQAMLALAHRRINVIWALLRDGTTYQQRSLTTLAAA
ncbi:transposase [Leifsonia xyli subsp. xyli]|uniref:Transposase, undefined n=2 Tax=Leifsonia xyli subsp. xyli TaxID=59736 RepID=Q6ACG7_LEIXX|nr:IS110 family transposase [Leifsonia xyli]AAT89926.1 transposase, undefined [Leifsonia xyli subsp. xyli str. CTCB07]ODA90099.1 transposase [Leifsonia xyli subsp. xyli]